MLQTSERYTIGIYLDFTTLDEQKGVLADSMISNIKTIMIKGINADQEIVSFKASLNRLIIGSCDNGIKIDPVVTQTRINADLIIFPYVKINYRES